MPIFEYQCARCGMRFERFVPNRNAKVACVNCQSESLEKQFSTFTAAKDSLARPVSGPACASCCPSGACQL